jgi:large subunit ribosomal protein L34e
LKSGYIFLIKTHNNIYKYPKIPIPIINYGVKMPRKSRRSRSLRRIHVRTAKGSKLVYAKRKPSKAHCAGCGQELHGVASARPVDMGKMSKTEKRPERPYAGMLCSKCMRLKIKESIKE